MNNRRGQDPVDRNNVVSIISKFKTENLKRYGIKKNGIFGSLALESASPISDIDVVVELDKPKISLTLKSGFSNLYAFFYF
jgi:predicted nucleotidyltransferase